MWYASVNVSITSFQLKRHSRRASRSDVAREPVLGELRFHAGEKRVGRRSPRPPSDTKTRPCFSATATRWRLHSVCGTSSKPHSSGRAFSVPSSAYVHAWYGTRDRAEAVAAPRQDRCAAVPTGVHEPAQRAVRLPDERDRYATEVRGDVRPGPRELAAEPDRHGRSRKSTPQLALEAGGIRVDRRGVAHAPRSAVGQRAATEGVEAFEQRALPVRCHGAGLTPMRIERQVRTPCARRRPASD
jgi:hypothetical protein